MEFSNYQFLVDGKLCADSEMSDSNKVYIALLELCGSVQSTAVTTPIKSSVTIEILKVVDRDSKVSVKKFSLPITILTPFSTYLTAVKQEFNSYVWQVSVTLSKK